MAVIKINKISNNLRDSLDYITNPEKTNNKMYVSSYNCSSDIDMAMLEFEMVKSKEILRRKDSIIAQHIKQSFSPDDKITPELAHQLGIQFCDELFQGEYQYIIATHLDKKHIHNHIICNTTNLVTHKKFRSNKQIYNSMQNISDKLCYNNNLSVIPKKISNQKGKSYKEWQEHHKGKSFKSIIKYDIDECIALADNYDHFKALMEERKYVIKDFNKDGQYLRYISFYNEIIGMKKFMRGRNTQLGDQYTRENIQLRIKQKNLIESMEIDPRKLNSMIDMKTNEKAHTIIAYRKFAAKHNLKTYLETKRYMKEHNIENYNDFVDYQKNLQKEIKQKDKNIKNFQEQINHKVNIISATEDYIRLKDTFKTYKNLSGDKKKIYFIKNKSKLNRFKSVYSILQEEFPDKKIPNIKITLNEKDNITTLLEKEIIKHQELVEKNKILTQHMKNISKVLGNYERY